MDQLVRAARGAVIGVAVLGVSALFHTAAGGCADHLGQAAFWVLGAITIVACIAMSGRIWTFARLLLMLAIAQVALHAFLEGSLPLVLADGDHPHLHDHGLGAILGHVGIVMLVAHVAATVVLAAVLRFGDIWLHECARLISRALATLPVLVLGPLPAYAAPAPVAPTESGLRRIHIASAATHRGPPSLVVA